MSIATTRLARRRLAAPVLLLAAVAALVLNLLVAWVLSALAHRQMEQAEERLPPPRTIPVRRIAEPVPPPPPPTTRSAPAPAAEAPGAATAAQPLAPAAVLPALPLPSLDLAVPAPDLPTLQLAEVPAVMPSLPVLVAAVPDPAPLAAPSSPSAGGSRPPPADPLDGPPELLVWNDRFFYPPTARARGIEGDSRIELVVGADGVPTECSVISSTPPGVFDQAAHQAGLSVRYKPRRSAFTTRLTMQWRLMR